MRLTSVAEGWEQRPDRSYREDATTCRDRPEDAPAAPPARSPADLTVSCREMTRRTYFLNATSVQKVAAENTFTAPDEDVDAE